MLTQEEQFWAGDFGVEYVARNRVVWQDRMPLWQDILERTGARSVLEVGCNAGWNLRALRAVDRQLELKGVDVNDEALVEAGIAGLDVEAMSGALVGAKWPRQFDLVFTAGVLIHVGPDALRPVMDSIVNASARYVLAIEYEHDTEQEIIYRGHAGKLWKRPFGDLYQGMGLKLVDTGVAEGFDRCTYWLLERE